MSPIPDSKKLKSIKNTHISPLEAKRKKSTNFFTKSDSAHSTVRYDFDEIQTANVIEKHTQTVLNHPHTKHMKHKVKKHGIAFYSLSVTFIALFCLCVSIITLYSSRYHEISKSYKECVKSFAFLAEQEISSSSQDQCKNGSTPLWTLSYWENGLSYGDIVEFNNAIISANEGQIQEKERLWQDLRTDLSTNINLYASTKLTNVTQNQIIPDNSLPLGKKINIAQTQLLRFTEKNQDVAKEIRAIENDYTNKIAVYGDTLSLSSYDSFIDDYNILLIDQKLSRYDELTQSYTSLLIDIESGLQELEQNDPDTIAALLALEYNTYSGEEFYQLYANYTHKFVSSPPQTADITGDARADAYIEQKAIQRGYQKRNVAYESRLELYKGEYLQPEAREAFERMSLAASKESINLILVSGYRSVVEQKDIFNRRFTPYFSPDQILNGEADAVLESVLSTSSIPGYSKHHTGYAVDIGCSSRQITLFGNSKCYEWMQKNNFLNAKRFGFIPSYPEGVLSNQGPNPEPWEFVYIGVEKLKSITP